MKKVLREDFEADPRATLTINKEEKTRAAALDGIARCMVPFMLISGVIGLLVTGAIMSFKTLDGMHVVPM